MLSFILFLASAFTSDINRLKRTQSQDGLGQHTTWRPGNFSSPWSLDCYCFGSRLKYLDPVYTTTAGEIADIPDPLWLAKLDEAVRSLQAATTDYTTAEESMQAVLDQYPGWRWDGAQWVQEENGWPGGGQQEPAAAGGGGYPTLQEEYPGSLQGGEANVDQDAYLRQGSFPNQQQDYSSQEPHSIHQEDQASPHQASPEPPGGSSPEQESSPSHTVTDPTPSPEGFLGFNPSFLPPVAETPSYEGNVQKATFDPATLPPARKASLTDPASRLSNHIQLLFVLFYKSLHYRPGLHRQSSLGRSRQSSTSEPPSSLQPPPPSQQPPSSFQPPPSFQHQVTTGSSQT